MARKGVESIVWENFVGSGGPNSYYLLVAMHEAFGKGKARRRREEIEKIKQ